MTNPLVVLDQLLMDICTDISHWFQKLTGRNNFFITKVGLAVASITIGVQIADYFQPFLFLGTSFKALFLGFGILIGLFLQIIFTDHRSEQFLMSNERVAESKWESSLHLGFRLFFLFFSVFQTAIVVHDFSMFPSIVRALNMVGYPYGLTIYGYFLQVESLPPPRGGRSKIQQWISSLFGGSKELATAKE